MPVDDGGDFERIALGLKDGQLAGVEFTDRLGQKTIISFFDSSLNPALPADTFVFDVPDYVDIIDESDL